MSFFSLTNKTPSEVFVNRTISSFFRFFRHPRHIRIGTWLFLLMFYPVRNNAPLLPPGQRPSGPAAAAGLDFRIIPAGFNPLRQRLRGECPAGISNGVYFLPDNFGLIGSIFLLS